MPTRIKKQENGYFFGNPTAQEDDNSSTKYRKINVNGTFGVGYDLKLAKKLDVFFQPTFDCNLMDTAKKSVLHRRIYSLSFNIGLIIG